MFVGVGRFVLHIPSAQSLKQRRQVVRSCKDRIRAKLPVSIAEVGDVERLQVAALGVAVVSADSTRCDEILGAVRSMMSQLRDAVLSEVKTELIPLGDGGKGVAPDEEPALDGGPLGAADQFPEHWASAFPVEMEGANLGRAGRGRTRDTESGAGRAPSRERSASRRRRASRDDAEFDNSSFKDGEDT